MLFIFLGKRKINTDVGPLDTKRRIVEPETALRPGVVKIVALVAD